jgi:hypothetical protein
VGARGAPIPSDPLACHRGKGRLTIRQERRLILFDRQQIGPFGFHHLIADAALSGQRVSGHDAPRQGHVGQRLLDSRQLMPFAHTGHLRHDLLGLVGVYCDQMRPRNPSSRRTDTAGRMRGAPQRFAIHRQRLARLYAGL